MNDLMSPNTIHFRVWGTIAASTHDKKDKYEYRKQIHDWCSFLGTRVGTQEATKAILSATVVYARGYKEYLERQPGMKSRDGNLERSAAPAPATVRKKLAILRSIYRDLQEEGLMSSNPFLLRLLPDIEYQKRPTEMLPFSKVWEIITAPGSPEHMKRHNYEPGCDRIIRDRAILAVMFGGALRRSEVVKLRVGDVKTTNHGATYLHLRETKKHGDAEQAIPTWASEFLWAWHGKRLEKGALSSDFLFCRLWRDGKRHEPGKLYDGSVRLWLREYLHCVGLDPEIYSPHSARATAITKLLDQGYSHHEVKAFSRHTSVMMVEGYDKRRITVDENPGRELDFERKRA